MQPLVLPDDPKVLATLSPAERTARASVSRYPDLHSAGGMLRRYGRNLRYLCVGGCALAFVAFVFAEIDDDKARAAVVAAGAWSVFGWSFLAGILGTLFAAAGQACVALADIAVNAESTAESLRKASE